MLSYMLPTEDKPPPGDPSRKLQNHNDLRNYTASNVMKKSVDSNRTMNSTLLARLEDGTGDRYHQTQIQGQTVIPIESPKHNGTARKSTLHTSRVTKDDSLYSIDSDASTVGSERKNKILNGAKHASLKRVSFGSSKGSMVETLVYETPVQEEPENNHFLDHNGRLPASMIPVPDTDEGREKVRVSLLGTQPSPATPGVLLLDPIGPSTGHLIDIMAASPVELLTTHTEHTTPTYHTQISTDSGWDNPFRPDGDLSREADEIVELIKGGKPITPTPGQNAPPLPGCERKDEHDSSTSPLLDSTRQGNGNAHSTPMKNNQQPVNEKVGSTTSATVEVGRLTAQGPGDASQVEHVTLKKKPKCKCCVLQ
ncbi:uncharacterized protein LOC122497950 [Leptopilina heterotoma]|uniref:uncharacterized protein LOC122497950 n=1 Tax=Leptopilina heterotoma TaxID=63436 RepID=UPI001CA903B0|nr:uncharacterized protein LOC122497950 [Leptopilina heterotoma]XP_043461321.1 uncharacterized protein LOC122497950 [Leptopilina heterotoma]XP_043461322.1 uncharacterized protein LOC122497950 [Leptopilina heterotoma]XP_043461323.1 uncharacterized protein LOC122497950 [Leptopilina heterotoma]XP_043461324.1 uncharacterized protein LOC122497950 [Leptopilina heterotoma]